MPDLLKRIAAPLVFGALALLAVATMVSDRRSLAEGGRDLPWWQAVMLEVAVPIQDLVAAPVDSGRRLWEDYVVLLEVREENQRLRDRVVELEEENLQYREALVASEHLQQIAAMRHRFEVPMLPSEVVGLDVMPWFRAVLVDRGVSQGVRAGNPVITAEGVVGLVTATSQNAAKTMLLLDRQSAIDGIVQRSRARGIARGRGTDQLAFEFVVRGGDVRVGDVVITSGLGGVFPKGLRIGEIVGLSDSPGQLLQTATLQPSVDFGRLEQVFVMLRRGLTMDLLYGSADGAAPADTARAGGTAAARRRPAPKSLRPVAP
jgi:rod shape-determining protein MreC